jgi:hypothetical protein
MPEETNTRLSDNERTMPGLQKAGQNPRRAEPEQSAEVETITHGTATVDPSQKSERWRMRQARLDNVRRMNAVERVRVVPRDDVMRSALQHPTGIGFRPSGSVEWPNDRFTQRRLSEGTITLENKEDAEARAQQRAQAQPQLQPVPPAPPRADRDPHNASGRAPVRQHERR